MDNKMTPFGLLSDLHLEFGPYDGPWPAADVLLLSGDILVAAHLGAARHLDKIPEAYRDGVEKIVGRYDAFVAEACKRYRQVVWVAGNHEHYGSDVARTLQLIEEQYGSYANLQVLEKEAIQYEGILIFGATMWTNFNNHDRKAMIEAHASMNDYRQIWINDAGESRTITPAEIYEDHLVACEAFEHYRRHALDNGLKMVVMTHHAPSQRSCHPRFKRQALLNASYNSDLERLLGGNVALWVHGHTHDSYDYTINGTRIVCNPRGYWSEDMRSLNKKFNGNLVLEV